MLQSSSPSYPLMASLDLARAYLAKFKEMGVDYLTDKLLTMKNLLGDMAAPIKVGNYVQDPLKMVLLPMIGCTSYSLKKTIRIERYIS